MLLAYHLFKSKGVMPGQVAAMSPGERVIAEAMARREIEERKEYLENINT